MGFPIRRRQLIFLWGWFFLSFMAVLSLWFYSRPINLEWSNVPPAPSKEGAVAFALGDEQMAYRSLGMMVQFFGNTDGRFERFERYNYDALAQWFTVMDQLDPQADYLPFLVAYYFGAAKEPKQLAVVVDFLKDVGKRVGEQKWRWLTQAVYIARYRIEDTELAIQLARILAQHKDPDVDAWARNLEAIILDVQGDKEAAILLSLSLLKERADRLTDKEVYYLQSYICENLLEKGEQSRFSFCATLD